jgi:serine phosphatase RsbU (regulator of sigma subunit)
VNELVFPGGTRADGLPAALDDPQRLAAVEATGLLDTGPEPVFEDLAHLAAGMTGCSRAFITLVDDRRSFWKSCVGVDARDNQDRQARVEDSFCYFLVGIGGDRFAVDDAAADPRTRDHPSVKPMQIGAWAGYPILSSAGDVLGSMCVIDEKPHAWDAAELHALGTLARAVSNEITLRQSLALSLESLELTQALARSLQDSLLPPILEDVPGLEAAASYRPATGGTSVLGDFYDLFHVRGPWWCTVMGDVSGKGIEAAKLTALARYTFRAAASHRLSPAASLRELNAAVVRQTQGDRFLTAVAATFRVTPGGLSGRISSAGHPPALIRRAGGRVRAIDQHGPLLGIFPDITLADTGFRLGPGDALLLYTDGATEARRSQEHADRPLFGPEALTRAVADCRGLSAPDIVGHLVATLAHHSGDWASDDTALLALRVPPGS